MVSSFISALGGIDMALDGFDFDGFRFESPPPSWGSAFKYRKHHADVDDVSDAVRYAWSIIMEVTCLECEHFRQDSDDGTICPRCTKGQCVIISDGKKKKHCMHYDKMTTE